MSRHANQLAIGLQLLPLLTLTSFVLIGNTQSCMTHFQTTGVTYPEGDIRIEHGKPLEIYCILNETYIDDNGENIINDITFRRNNHKLPKEMINIVNKTTIKLYIKKPPPSTSMYYCINEKYDSTVCLNSVIVGMKPSEITDFSCVGYNFVNLTCSWTAPQSYVKTTYTLKYRFQGRGGRSYYSCPKMKPSTSVHNKTNMSCFWDISTDPLYRQHQPYYFFTLIAENEFGNVSVTYNFTHFANVIPEPPNNLSIVGKTTNSLLLNWNVGLKIRNFPPGLVHRVKYQCEFDTNDTWRTADTSMLPLKNSTYLFNLTGLPYAHALYDIRVSARSAKALDEDERMWSRFASITTRTVNKLPAAPPKLNMGSFEIINGFTNRGIIIYWQYIPGYMKNGENVTYQFISILEDLKKRSIVPTELTNTYAKFSDLSLKSYKFTIATANEIGLSMNFSQIFVPSYYNKIPEPTDLSKIAYPNSTYELSWVPPVIPDKNRIKIDNYTIFWCNNDKDRPYLCKGYLQWVEVPPNLTNFNVTVPTEDVYQFAVSANTKLGSSGMVWTSCTVIPMNGGIGKMNNININRVGSTFMYLTWKLGCSDHVAGIEGFKIYYCPIKSPVEPTCREEEQKVLTINNPNAKDGNVTSLKPYTTYMLTVSVITKYNTTSLQSERLYNTTTESAPDSPPQNIQIRNVTNSSISLSWSPPFNLNGKLKYYEISFKESNSIGVDHKKIEPDQEEHVLHNLKSYMEYKIWIKACTVGCSEDSEAITQTTAVSEPGLMRQPIINNPNASLIQISWEPPESRGGTINNYELKIKEKFSDRNITKIINTTDLRYMLPSCQYPQTHEVYYFSVRAVNIKNNKSYVGPWSPEAKFYCHPATNYLPIFFTILFCGLLIALIMFYCTYRIYRCLRKKYLSMQNIKVKLPQGLETDHDIDQKSTTKEIVISLKTSSEIDPISDDQMLLDSKTDGTLCEDSSGCSSGQESVHSSLASGGNLSNNTDSGTEQPNTAEKNVAIKVDDNLNKEGSLRLRKPASQTANYCILGIENNTMSEPNGFVAIPKMATPIELRRPSGQQATALFDKLQPSELGYSTIVPTSKLINLESKPYVMYESPDSNLKTDWTSIETEPSVNDDYLLNKPYCRLGVETKNTVQMLPLTNAPNFMLNSNEKTEPIHQKPSSFINEPAKGYVSHKIFDSKMLKGD